MKAKEYLIFSECVERGTKAGVRKAMKHSEESLGDDVIDRIVELVAHYIGLEVCEYFTFEDLKEEQP